MTPVNIQQLASHSLKMGEDIVSGIYAIENVVTGDIYIGSSRNIASRWLAHLHLLKRSAHTNKKLQAAFDKDGLSNIRLKVLETCEGESALRDREIHYIEQLNPVLNGKRTSQERGNRPVKTVAMKYTSISTTLTAFKYLKNLAKRNGLNRSNMIEILIRKEAQSLGYDDEKKESEAG